MLVVVADPVWFLNHSLQNGSKLYRLIQKYALDWMQVGNQEDKIMVCVTMG